MAEISQGAQISQGDLEPKCIDPDLKKGFFLLQAIWLAMTIVMIFLNHKHLSLLRTELSFTHSLHAKTTKNLSGRTNPQHVLLAWNQNPSAKRDLIPLNSPLSSRDRGFAL